jgi:deoxycytidylate deaminase
MKIVNENLRGKCVKQTVIAIISNNGKHYIGTNWCKNLQTECPRDVKGMKTGEGYEFCKNVCKQDGHAEENAILMAGEEAKGATMLLIGHYYMCDRCQKACKEAGIKDIVILDDMICKERKK